MYRFGQVAHAVGLGEPALRNWLRRNKVDLYQEQPVSGWRVFVEKDVLVLALAVQLVRFGSPVKAAVEAVQNGLFEWDFETWENLPEWLYFAPSPYDETWEAASDEKQLSSLFGPVYVKVHVPLVLREAHRRLLNPFQEG